MELKLKAVDIKKELIEECPLLRKENIWLTDDEYIIPSLDEVNKIIKKLSVSKIPYKNRKVECEEYALFLMADIRRYHIFNTELDENWAFGITTGYFDSFFSGRIVHDNNICLTIEGLKIIDPQIDTIFDFNENIFNPFFVRM